MKRIMAILGLCTFFITHTDVVNQAVFQTPDGTQIALFGEEHSPTRPKDEEQVSSLLASIKKVTSETDRRLHVMLEEPSKLTKSRQAYAKVTTRLRQRLNLEKNKKIKAENAEIRCAAAAARFILNPERTAVSLPNIKLDAKKPFASRKLSKWQSSQGVKFSDVYNEFEEAFDKIEKIRSVEPLRSQLAEFKQTYEKYADATVYSASQTVDDETRYDMYSRLNNISDKLLDYYLLVRALEKSRTKDVLIVAGKNHIGALRGLLQDEFCSLVEYKSKIEGELTLQEFSRIKTAYLKLLRYYLKFKRMIITKKKLLRSYLPIS